MRSDDTNDRRCRQEEPFKLACTAIAYILRCCRVGICVESHLVYTHQESTAAIGSIAQEISTRESLLMYAMDMEVSDESNTSVWHRMV